jgi:glycerol uptake facilitator-like aquaporin
MTFRNIINIIIYANSIMINKYLAEFLGSLLFFYVILESTNAIVIGAALTLTIMIVSSVTNGNFNPVVTIMLTAAGKQSVKDAMPFIIAQIMAGLVAVEIYKRT